MMGQKEIAVVQERDDGGLKYGTSCGDHKKWLDSGYILNLEQSGCTNDFVWPVRKRRLKDDFKNGSYTVYGEAIHTQDRGDH